MQRELKDFETIFCTTLTNTFENLDEKWLLFLSPKFQPPLPRGHLLGALGKASALQLKDQHRCTGLPSIWNTDVLPTLLREKPGPPYTQRLAEPLNALTPSTQPSRYWRKRNFLFESLLLKFSIIRNKMNFWLEHILCCHDKPMPCLHLKHRHKARMPLRLLACVIMLEVVSNAMRQANQKYKQ